MIQGRDAAFDTIRSLIEVIRLRPGDGQMPIEIKGELGGILALCEASETRKPGRDEMARLKPSKSRWLRG